MTFCPFRVLLMALERRQTQVDEFGERSFEKRYWINHQPINFVNSINKKKDDKTIGTGSVILLGTNIYLH